MVQVDADYERLFICVDAVTSLLLKQELGRRIYRGLNQMDYPNLGCPNMGCLTCFGPTHADPDPRTDPT
jgi:hypothetical protein